MNRGSISELNHSISFVRTNLPFFLSPKDNDVDNEMRERWRMAVRKCFPTRRMVMKSDEGKISNVMRMNSFDTDEKAVSI